MELRRLWLLIWHRKLLVVLLVAAALAAGYQVTPKTASYKALSVLFVGIPEGNAFGVYSSDLQTGQEQLAETFAIMIPSAVVAEGAVQLTGVPRSAGQVLSEIKTVVVPGSTLIEIGVTDPNPVVAQDLANGVAQAFVNQITKIDPVTSNTTGGKTSTQSPASISQPAGLPLAPLDNGLKRNLILSGIFGLLIAVGLVLLLDYLDVSVRSPDDLERRIGLPVLGIIPLYSRLTDRDFVSPARHPAPEPGLTSTLDG
jgi:succinoglycan biosynthesis transport protein ExoP